VQTGSTFIATRIKEHGGVLLLSTVLFRFIIIVDAHGSTNFLAIWATYIVLGSLLPGTILIPRICSGIS
jgi:hypothetical protein